jgi:hypothetical protein
MSEFLKNEGCSKVGYEESMWQVTQNGYNIVLASHIDDFVIVCAHRPTLDSFRSRLLEVFDGTYEGGENGTAVLQEHVVKRGSVRIACTRNKRSFSTISACVSKRTPEFQTGRTASLRRHC